MAHWLSRVQICCHLSAISSIVVSFSLSFHPHSFHTRTHTHMLTHWLRISNYSQTPGDWHYWHGLDRSLVQLPFQRLYCSIFGNYTSSPTPLLRLSLSLSPGISLLLSLLSLSSSRGWRCGRGQQQPSLWWLHDISIWDRCPAACCLQLTRRCSWGAGRAEGRSGGRQLERIWGKEVWEVQKIWEVEEEEAATSRRRIKVWLLLQEDPCWRWSDQSWFKRMMLQEKGDKTFGAIEKRAANPLTRGRISSSRRRRSSVSGNPCHWEAAGEWQRR